MFRFEAPSPLALCGRSPKNALSQFWIAVASAARHRFRACGNDRAGVTNRTRRSVSKAPSPLRFAGAVQKTPSANLSAAASTQPFLNAEKPA